MGRDAGRAFKGKRMTSGKAWRWEDRGRVWGMVSDLTWLDSV